MLKLVNDKDILENLETILELVPHRHWVKALRYGFENVAFISSVF